MANKPPCGTLTLLFCSYVFSVLGSASVALGVVVPSLVVLVRYVNVSKSGFHFYKIWRIFWRRKILTTNYLSFERTRTFERKICWSKKSDFFFICFITFCNFWYNYSWSLLRRGQGGRGLNFRFLRIEHSRKICLEILFCYMKANLF